jgi:hypothetical protein
MSKWLMRGHFRHLHFGSFPMIWRTSQGEVFWPLQLSSEILRVLKDSQVPISGVWVSSSHSLKIGLRQKGLVWVIMVNVASYGENTTCNKCIGGWCSQTFNIVWLKLGACKRKWSAQEKGHSMIRLSFFLNLPFCLWVFLHYILHYHPQFYGLVKL